jgi:HlyD family secretion protein
MKHELEELKPLCLKSSNEQHNGHRPKIRILIVDDQKTVREQLQFFLDSVPDFQIVGMAEDGSTALKQLESWQPDILLIDLEMPGMGGIKAIQIITKRYPECKIIVFSSHESSEYINQSLRAGAKGYLRKGTTQEEAIETIRTVYKGYGHLSPGLLEKLQLAESNSERNVSRVGELTESNPEPERTEYSTIQQKLFRQKSLEQLSSPERLDQLLRVVSPKSWISLATFGCLVISGFAWSIFGRIPFTVEGRGVLIYPGKVVPLQSSITGQVKTLNVEAGDFVKQGEVIATIERVDLRQQLQLAREKLQQLQQQNLQALSLLKKRQDTDQQSITQQRETLTQKLTSLQQLTPLLQSKSQSEIALEGQNLKQRLKTLTRLQPTFQKRLTKRRQLINQGAISDDTLLQTQQEYIENLNNIEDVKLQLKQIETKKVEALQKYWDNLNQIKNVKAQLQELSSKKANTTQQDLEATTARQKEIQEQKRTITGLQQQIKDNSSIISQHTGKVLETLISPGQVLDSGTRLANINLGKPSDELVSITYHSVADGKKIQTEMGMQITPQTVKRERFGGIIGEVTQVSAFPIAKAAAINTVGNAEVVEGLVANNKEGLIQVVATLKPDDQTYSGYEWSSSAGPQLKISPGTTTIARVTVEERAPITFVLPILRSLSGIY